MKKALATLSLSLATATAFAQGLVNFYNNATSLVSVGAEGQQALISGTPGSYFFGLLTAPSGTTDPNQFTFADVYATNRGALFPGQLFGGVGIAVTSWPTALFRSFLVAGWSSSLGHDWTQQWLKGNFGNNGYFGLSPIALGAPGGAGGGLPSPSLDLFGGVNGIQTGWNLAPVPEPSTAAITALGGATLMLFWRSRKKGITGVTTGELFR